MNATSSILVTKAQLDTFCTQVQAFVDDYMSKNFPRNPRKVISVEPGRKYARLVATDESQRSSYCFVDMTNGDILKCESWKKPAKHARGNIFRDPLSGLTISGARYL